MKGFRKYLLNSWFINVLYVSFLRAVFLSPDPVLNGFAKAMLIITKPFTSKKNYFFKFDELLQKLATKNHPYLHLARKLARSNPAYWQAFAKNLIINRLVCGANGKDVPSQIEITISGKCNIACSNCYAERFPKIDLPTEVIDKAITEGSQNGTVIYSILGGEPLLREDMWEVYENHPDVCFIVFTNGTTLDRKAAERIAKIGNLFMSVSLDGFEEKTDARRGEGVYQKAIEAMEHLRAVNHVFGVTVTVTRENFDEIVSSQFTDMVVEKGAYGIVYNQYIPTDSNPNENLILTKNQKLILEMWSEVVKDKYPLYVRCGRAAIDELRVCDAADRHFHITPSGSVEPCLFSNISAGNIRDMTIMEIMDSPLFRGIRALGEKDAKPCVNYKKQNLQKASKAKETENGRQTVTSK
ncbi:MAG: radical SAM protein [bacterium]|nr:radical SAM protein [bacterium]